MQRFGQCVIDPVKLGLALEKYSGEAEDILGNRRARAKSNVTHFTLFKSKNNQDPKIKNILKNISRVFIFNNTFI